MLSYYLLAAYLILIKANCCFRFACAAMFL